MRFVTLRRMPTFKEPAPKGGRASVIIDETLAALLWPDGRALGRTFIWKALDISYTVVGIAGPMGGHPRAAAPVPAMVTPQDISAVDGIQPLRLIMRALPDGRRQVGAVASVLRQLFPDAPIMEVSTPAALLEVEMAQERMGARIFSYYAGAAVLLALAGVYGLLVFLSRQSRREFAVRHALGASPRSLARLAVMRVLLPVTAGAAAGVLASHAFGAALAARIVGLGSIQLSSSILAGSLFTLLAVLTALAAAAPAGRARPDEILRAN
ncbi:MAG TPA: FtsX-like permease family protein [Vicinamibacterales bacterium]|nr:FtsX-like permease family protein [Vicinamibacterales bacterium]